MNPIDRFAKYLLKSFLLCSLALFLYPLTAIGQPGTFMATGSMTTPRFQHTVTVLANGQVLVAGGADRTNFFNPVASAELYNPATVLAGIHQEAWLVIDVQRAQPHPSTAAESPDWPPIVRFQVVQ